MCAAVNKSEIGIHIRGILNTYYSWGNLPLSHALAWEWGLNLYYPLESKDFLKQVFKEALTVTKLRTLIQLRHRSVANAYYDVKLKRPARRNENIYDVDCYPRQEESDQRVNQIVLPRLLYYC